VERFIIPACIVLMVAATHYAYLDYRARLRGGITWFWTAWDKPVLHWVSNVAVMAALGLALYTFFVGLPIWLIVAILVLLIVHVVTLELTWSQEP
jgi:hypothetical protein